MRLTVTEAAKRLGISDNAVRMRIQRGKLQATKIDNTVYVEIPNDEPTPNIPNTDHTQDQTLLVQSLQDQIEYLRKQLDQANEANSQLRQLLAALTSRIPELPASNTTASDEPTDSTQDTATPAPERRSFWQRLFS